MKISLKHIVSFAVAMSVSAAALADDLADFKKWYTKEGPNMVKAMEGKKIEYFNKCSTADFTYKEASGKTAKKKEAIAGLKSMMDSTDKISYKFKVTGTKASKSTMVVDLTNEYTMHMKPGPPDNKKHVMWMKSKTRETWVKSGSKWLLKHIADIGTPETKMDGKAMPGTSASPG